MRYRFPMRRALGTMTPFEILEISKIEVFAKERGRINFRK